MKGVKAVHIVQIVKHLAYYLNENKETQIEHITMRGSSEENKGASRESSSDTVTKTRLEQEHPSTMTTIMNTVSSWWENMTI